MAIRSAPAWVPMISVFPSTTGSVRATSPLIPVYSETGCCQMTAPVAALTAVMSPPQSGTYATPLTTAGVAETPPGVGSDHAGASRDTVDRLIFVSAAWNRVSDRFCPPIPHVTVAGAAVVAGAPVVAGAAASAAEAPPPAAAMPSAAATAPATARTCPPRRRAARDHVMVSAYPRRSSVRTCQNAYMPGHSPSDMTPRP